MKKLSIILIGIVFFGMLTVVAQEDLYQPVDIQPAANGRVYLDNEQEPGANVSWAEAEPGDTDFMIFQNNDSNRFAICTSSIQSQLQDGKLIDKAGIPYDIGLKEVISLRSTTVPQVRLELTPGYYQNLYFLYSDIGGINSGVSVNLEYSDGSVETIDDLVFQNSYLSNTVSEDEDVVAIVDRYNSFGRTNFRLLQYVGIFRHSVPVDGDKVLQAVSFVTTSDYELKILAVTGEIIDTNQLTQKVQEKLLNLSDDPQYLKDLKVLIENLQNRGVPVSELEGYEEFLILYENLVYEPQYQIIDISSSANSKVYIDSSPTPGQPVSWNDFITGPLDGVSYQGNAMDRAGLQISSLQEQTEDGFLTDSQGVKYHLTFSNVITVVNSSPVSEVDVANRVYRSVNILATTICNGSLDMDVEVVYTDGTTETNTIAVENCYGVTSGDSVVAAPAMYVAWGGADFTKALTLAVRQYQVQVDTEKEVDHVIFRNDDITDVKILAITGIEGSNSQIKKGVAGSIANLKKDGDYLQEIQNNLELLKQRGIFVDDIPGLDRFYDAYGKCVYVQSVDQMANFDVVDFCFHFLNPIWIEENMITVSKNGELFADITIKVIGKELHVYFSNDMEYDAVYTITLAESLRSEVDSSYTLGREAVYNLKVIAPVYYEDTSVNANAGMVSFQTNLRSNLEDTTNVKLFIAIYTQEGEMLDNKSIDCVISAGGEVPISTNLTPGDQTGLIVECYMLDNYNNLRYLYPEIKIEI